MAEVFGALASARLVARGPGPGGRGWLGRILGCVFAAPTVMEVAVCRRFGKKVPLPSQTTQEPGNAVRAICTPTSYQTVISP